MGVLLSPINPIGKGIKWALVVHTVALFSFLTVPVVIYLNNLSIMYIKSREFPGNDEYPPGPIGYYDILDTGATGAIFGIMFPLNQWLADGLLVGPVSNSLDRVFNVPAHPASSLLRHLFHEPLGHGIPIPDVPRLYRYVPEPFALQ